jgi:predicted helicase
LFRGSLKRAFPKIPLHDDFEKWVSWGKQLMTLHCGYESVETFNFVIEAPRIKTKVEKGEQSLPRLVVKHEPTRILLDSDTVLTGIPPAAWKYEISSRSAIEWVLQHYRKLTSGHGEVNDAPGFIFHSNRNEIIDLLGKVVTISFRTQQITVEMAEALK